MSDDALIRQYCEQHSLSFQWETRAEGDRSYASLQVWRDAESIFWQGTDGRYSEQELLDGLMNHAINDIEAPPQRYIISGWKPARQ